MKGKFILRSIVGVCCIFITFFCFYMFVSKGVIIWRDVDTNIERVWIVSDYEDMMFYLTDLKNNMIKHHMTRGYSSFVSQSPEHDMSLSFARVSGVLKKLESLKDCKECEPERRQAVRDSKIILRKLTKPALYWMFAKYWYVLIIGSVAYIFIPKRKE